MSSLTHPSLLPHRILPNPPRYSPAPHCPRGLLCPPVPLLWEPLSLRSQLTRCLLCKAVLIPHRVTPSSALLPTSCAPSLTHQGVTARCLWSFLFYWTLSTVKDRNPVSSLIPPWSFPRPRIPSNVEFWRKEVRKGEREGFLRGEGLDSPRLFPSDEQQIPHYLNLSHTSLPTGTRERCVKSLTAAEEKRGERRARRVPC